jgi:hypothetical protein
MRTKALLGLAALAVSAVTCVAQQNVYSLNIVGYVNVDITNGYNLLTVPLKPTDGNMNITNTIVLPAGADNSGIFKWTGSSYDLANIPTWVESAPGVGEWISDQPVSIQVGEAFFLNSTATGKITFVGEVMTGAIQNSLAPGYNAVGNKVPVQAGWPGKTVGNDGDGIQTWLPAQQSFDVANPWTFIAGEGWTITGATFTDGPVLAPGQGVFYFNTGTAPINWTQNFNPQ